jgi:protein associated with RNAse G/E
MPNNQIEIISYKHDGGLHRVWQYAYVIKETEDMIVIVNDKASVIDGDGRRWKTKEPAVCYFFKKHWFNIICMLRADDIYYYCNLSSPYILDSEGLKYIDYDLDVKVFPSGDKIILDRDEFDFNLNDMKYPSDLINVIEENLKVLLKKIENGEKPFDRKSVYEDYQLYARKDDTK